MAQRHRINLKPQRLLALVKQSLDYTSGGQFIRDVGLLIWEYKWYSLAIFGVTIFQEFAAIWPVNLLGDFIDALTAEQELSRLVWMLLGASLFYPALVRANTVLRHKMFYDTDMEKRTELVFQVSDAEMAKGPERAGAAYTRVVNAVSGLTNTAYHLLGSFTPVFIKIIIVSGNLLARNRTLAWVYLGSLAIPAIMTIIFNKRMVVLRDSQYSVIGEASGVGIEAIGNRDNSDARSRFAQIMRERRSIMMSLLKKSQNYLFLRQGVLIISQFVVVFIALGIRERVGITPGDFSKIIGYTTQVAAAFITAAAQMDNIISYSRAYHVYAMANRPAVA